ncbi:xylose isomerase-like protein [Hymenopellis radicata]|nr:xylose isomerase-like protein [Hymenopellis radicata]
MQGATGDFDKIVADLREIGEMGLKEDPPIRFAYECMAWGAHVDTWEQTWDIVERVSLPNFGIVLDTFQILGCIWADPTEVSGKLASGPTSLVSTISKLKSLAPKLLPKVFYIQLCDAELLSPPISPAHPFYDREQKPRMMWSRNARLFPCEYGKGAYLPVIELAKAIFNDLGYRGWVSLEVFARSAAEEGQHVPQEHAERAAKSWTCFLAEAGYA